MQVVPLSALLYWAVAPLHKHHECVLVQLAGKRPVSPHVFEVDAPTQFHYKMPINAVSSIANRVSGSILTGGEWHSNQPGYPQRPQNAQAPASQPACQHAA